MDTFTILKVNNLITPSELIENGIVVWENSGKIIYSGNADGMPDVAGKTISASHIAVPGFIDMHVHGGFGIAFGIGEIKDELAKYSSDAARYGVTGFIITVSGPSSDEILKMVRAYVPLLQKEYIGAQPIGLHLEGPFLNPEKAGAYNKNWLHSPALSEMQSFVDAGEGWIKHVTLAPELPGATEVAGLLAKHNIHASLGHSSTDYETAQKALAGPFTHITHTFNAQSSLHHRAPGVVGAILTSESATAELIADGYHVHPAAMRILIKCLGSDRICLITDAMPGAGLPDGEYDLLGQVATVKNGAARLADGTFAGSTATMDACVRNMVMLAGTPLQQAAKMASTNPARVLGYENELGQIDAGKQADITLLDDNLHVSMTIRNGQIIFKE